MLERLSWRNWWIAFAIAAAGTPALAQQTVRILTPTVDTCRAYTAAMVAPDKTALTALGGWVVGYLTIEALSAARAAIAGTPPAHTSAAEVSHPVDRASSR